jgi:hypothetical protein
MCNKKNYKRFKKILEKHLLRNNNIYPTALGDRKICVFEDYGKRNIFLNYIDKDNTPLFTLCVSKKGEIDIVQSRVDDLAIFAAIYELEIMLKINTKSEILEKIFEITYEYNNFELLSLTMYR